MQIWPITTEVQRGREETQRERADAERHVKVGVAEVYSAEGIPLSSTVCCQIHRQIYVPRGIRWMTK